MIRRFSRMLPFALIGIFWAATGEPSRAQTGSIFLLDLPGDRVGVRYSHGSLDRAVQLQDSFDLMVEDFRSWTRAKVNLVILLLSREEWGQSGMTQPYGMAEPAGGSGLALPAWGDDGTVELWHKLLGTRLPTQPDQPMRGTPEQAASLALADLVGGIDGARILLRAGGIRGDQPWVERVIAQVILLSHLESHYATRLPDVRMVYEDLAVRGGGTAVWPLSGASSPRDLTARLWFESQFFDAAGLLTGPGCRHSPKAIFKQARKGGGRIQAAELLAKCPDLSSWMTGSFKAQ